MRRFPAPIHNLVAALSLLPGVGPKTALRYTYAILRFSKTDQEHLAKAILTLGETITVCGECRAYSQEARCEVCADERREKDLLCVVAESRDIATLEQSGTFRGRYFVLGGLLNPIEGITPDRLNVHVLLDRIKNDSEIKEVILAFNPNVHGEATTLYLAKLIKPFSKKISRLARGLPLGAEIEYADEVTLGEAVIGRRDV